MIDFHSHILPGMDDGSRNTKESIAILEESASQGVTTIAATSHFYADDNDPMRFIRRRRRSRDRLLEALGEKFGEAGVQALEISRDVVTAGESMEFSGRRAEWPNAGKRVIPSIRLGAEVHYFEGISRVAEIPLLRIQGTELLLVEMAFHPWNNRMVNDILRLHEKKGVRVLLAHIERYRGLYQEGMMDELLSAGVLIQSNAAFFLQGFESRKAFAMLREEQIHLLGTDAHNMSSRPPKLGAARRMIEKKAGKQVLDRIDSLGAYLLGEDVPKDGRKSRIDSVHMLR